jgi:hypothetical protein
MAADQNTHPSRDHAATPGTQPKPKINLRYVALGLEDAMLVLLGQLQSHGLIDSRSPVTPGGAMTPEPRYFITAWGRRFLDRLADDTDEALTD